jgi:hypothetical protein
MLKSSEFTLYLAVSKRATQRLNSELKGSQ